MLVFFIMNDNIIVKIKSNIQTFHLPRYKEITDVGLYLEQVVRFVNIYLNQMGCAEITSSMVSNYVKQGTIPRPVKKAYSADAIAYLIFVSIVKSVMPLEDIRMLIQLQKDTYSLEQAYNYFCDEVENVLQYIYGFKSEMEHIGVTSTWKKDLLRNTIIAVGQQIYLNSYLNALHKAVDDTDENSL